MFAFNKFRVTSTSLPAKIPGGTKVPTYLSCHARGGGTSSVAFVLLVIDDSVVWTCCDDECSWIWA